MARGKRSAVGDTRVAPNGYHYTRTEEGWELTHKLIAEQKLGRKLLPNERCRFKDNDRTNLTPDNIIVYEGKPKGSASERARLEARIEEMQARLAELADG
jgi:hypothetical protein